MISALLGLAAAIYAVTVFWYWRPLWVLWNQDLRRLPTPHRPPLRRRALWPRVVVVSPVRGAPGSIAGLVANLRNQDYPHGLVRLIVAVDPEGEDDPSAEIARRAGAEVWERRQPERIRTKGASLNEVLDRVKDEPWDLFVVLDVDARAGRDFLSGLAARWLEGAAAVQLAPSAKTPAVSVTARINHVAQLLSGLVQRGRAALGQAGILSGTGMAFRRETLATLDWRTSTGRHLSDDGELNFRCLLAGIPVTYAPELRLLNDVPTHPEALRRQRRNWFASYVEALPYLLPLLKKGLAGDAQVLEALFFLEFLPGCSLSLAAGTLAAILLAGGSVTQPFLRPWAALVIVVWALHALYYAVAFSKLGVRLTIRELGELPRFLAIRLAALVDGAILGSRSDPGGHTQPSAHADPPAAQGAAQSDWKHLENS